jgi:hypothetical protein
MNKITLGPDGRLYSIGEQGAVAAGVPAMTSSTYRYDNAGGSMDIESSASMYELP